MARARFARPVLEKSIEDACRKIAETRGGRLIKTVAIGWPGFPDRMLLMPDDDKNRGYSFFIEFKRGKEQPTDLQTKWHKILRDADQQVEVVRSVDQFKALL